MATKTVYLTTILFVCHILNGKAQNNDKLFDNLFNSRRNYVEAIPEKFRYHYNFIIDVGYQEIMDTLKECFSSKNLSNALFMIESVSTDQLGEKKGQIWTDDFIISYSWNAKSKKVEIENYTSHTDTTFVKDIENWNENVTNRSYYSWASGTGGGFILCSKVTFKSNQVEMMHSAFKSYSKDEPLHCIREQPEDDYKLRLQVNCDWITDDKREEVIWFLIGYHKEQESKIFDCEGNEIEFEQDLEQSQQIKVMGDTIEISTR